MMPPFLQRRSVLSSLLVSCMIRPAMADTSLSVVAAEAVWGDIASQIGGTSTQVTSLLNNPGTDPHLFEPAPSTARQIAKAVVIISNGGGYDPWMSRLIPDGAPHTILDVAELVSLPTGDNPHIWFCPETVRRVAQRLADIFSELIPSEAPQFRQRLQDFSAIIDALNHRIETLHEKFSGLPIAATEPLCTPLTDLLGLEMMGAAFQKSIMNDTEPTPSSVAEMELAIHKGQIRLLIGNAQTTTPATRKLEEAAQAAGIPVLMLHETLPANMHWQDWMNHILDRLSDALSSSPHITSPAH